MDEHTDITGRRAPPPEVWEAVKADYLAGLSGPDCCRRHGVTLSALRDRAARHGWRRSDQPWTPPQSLDPWDEGRILEERIGGNLDLIEWGELSGVAEGRMMRAVLRGDAVEFMRWHKVVEILNARETELRRWAEEEDARDFHSRRDAGEPDSTDYPDSGLARSDISSPSRSDGEVDARSSRADGGGDRVSMGQLPSEHAQTPVSPPPSPREATRRNPPIRSAADCRDIAPP